MAAAEPPTSAGAARPQSLQADHWLAVARRHLAPLFGGAAEVARLAAVARHLPATCQLILESRLHSGDSRVDLSVQVASGEQARELLTAPFPAATRRILGRWADPAGEFGERTPLWLEFDLPDGAAALPPPVLCARLAPSTRPAWLLGTLLPALFDGACPEPAASLAARLIGELPSQATVLYVFALLPRPGAPLRLEICGLGFSEILSWLAGRVPGEVAAAWRELAELFAGVERLHLSVDLDHELGARIGVEGSFPGQPPRQEGWSAWLARLVASGLGSAERAAAALAWPGRAPGYVRGLSHVKVVRVGTEAPQAKLYGTLVPLAGVASSRARASVRST